MFFLTTFAGIGWHHSHVGCNVFIIERVTMIYIYTILRVSFINVVILFQGFYGGSFFCGLMVTRMYADGRSHQRARQGFSQNQIL